jgi:hypothetical protein
MRCPDLQPEQLCAETFPIKANDFTADRVFHIDHLFARMQRLNT